MGSIRAALMDGRGDEPEGFREKAGWPVGVAVVPPWPDHRRRRRRSHALIMRQPARRRLGEMEARLAATRRAGTLPVQKVTAGLGQVDSSGGRRRRSPSGGWVTSCSMSGPVRSARRGVTSLGESPNSSPQRALRCWRLQPSCRARSTTVNHPSESPGAAERRTARASRSATVWRRSHSSLAA